MEPLSIAKFFTGFNLTGFVKAFAVLCKIAVIVGIIYAVYITAIKPHFNPTPTQRAGQIINNNYPEKKSLFDFKVWIIRVMIW